MLSDFFLFRKFISQDVLIIFYFFGAVVLPFFIWKFYLLIVKKVKIFNSFKDSFSKNIWEKLSIQQKIYFITFFTVMFLFCELIWRMMFEFLIAYMQIRDALVL